MKLKVIGLSLILFAFVFGVIFGSKYFKEYSARSDTKNQDSIEEELREEARVARDEYLETSSTSSSESGNQEEANIRVADNDVVAKLTINACKVDSLVYENEEDDFYLRKDASGNESRHGEIYTNCYRADVPIIYGHHMTDGTMFGSLDACYVGAPITLEDIGWLRDEVRSYAVTEIINDVPADEVWDKLSGVDDGLVLITCSYGVEDGRLIVIAKESPAD